MSDFMVHTIPGSPFARAVMATLEEKRADWHIAPLAPGAQKQPPHLARQPFGRMPALEHGDFLLYETQASLRYLDRVLPEPPLTPDDPRAAARMDQAMSINDWYLFQNCGNIIGFQRVVGPALMGLTPDEAVIAEAMPRAHGLCRAVAPAGRRRMVRGRAVQSRRSHGRTANRVSLAHARMARANCRTAEPFRLAGTCRSETFAEGHNVGTGHGIGASRLALGVG